jgi:tetratricopeptide (TPR) repeat protein
MERSRGWEKKLPARSNVHTDIVPFTEGLYAKGIDFIRRGEWDDAAKAFEQAVEGGLDLFDAYFHLAEVYGKLATKYDDKTYIEKAVSALKRAVELRPDHPHAHLLLATALGVFALWSEAVVPAEGAIQAYGAFKRPDKPWLAEALFLRARAYGAVGRWSEAQQDLQQAISVKEEIRENPTEQYYYLGALHFEIAKQNGEERVWRLEQSIDAYREAIDLDPNHSQAHSSLGLVYRELGRHEEALAEILHAEEADPENLVALHNLTAAYFQLDQFENALSVGERLLKQTPDDVGTLSNYAAALSGLERYEEAEIVLRKALSIDPRYWIAHATLGNVYLLQGRLEEAEQTLQQASALKPDDASIQHNLQALKREQLSRNLIDLGIAVRVPSGPVDTSERPAPAVVKGRSLSEIVVSDRR